MATTSGTDLFATDSADRVRAHTSAEVQSELDQELVARIHRLAEQSSGGPDSARALLSRRIEELEQETDIERTLAANAAVLALTGTALSALHSRRWLIVPTVVTSFLLQHALHGWCPPVPLFRRLGLRSRQEIDAERFATKALRGDFADVPAAGDPGRRADAALAAVSG